MSIVASAAVVVVAAIEVILIRPGRIFGKLVPTRCVVELVQ